MLDFANDLFFLLFLGGKNVNTLVLGTDTSSFQLGDVSFACLNAGRQTCLTN